MAFRCQNFQLYKDLKQFVLLTYRITSKFGREHTYGITDQARRAALSSLLNFAEGCDKGSDKDFNRYILNSLGSLSETFAALEVAKDLGILNKEDHSAIAIEIEKVSNKLGALSKTLKNSQSNKPSARSD